MNSSRRKAVRLLLGTGAGLVGLGAAGLGWLRHTFDPETPLGLGPGPAVGGLGLLPPTPPCGRDLAPTKRAIEGPFYRPDSPRRAVLREADTVGRPLVIEGRVLTTDCRAVAGAVLDFWSCDGRGVYDNAGSRLRGHQFADAEGRFRVETVKPADYEQYGMRRTAHVHVKVQGRQTPLLTTQLFFPGEPHNERDWLLDESLVMQVEPAADGALLARFDFVLRPA